jgi:CubicO group peptidase (beta-lactamase class C family)
MPRLAFLLLAGGTVLIVAAGTAFRPDRAARVATGFSSHVLCSETFVSGLDPDSVGAETFEAMPGVGAIRWAMGRNIDRERREVTVTLAGGFASRAVYRDGLGCMIMRGDEPVDGSLLAASASPQAASPEIAGPAPVEPADAALRDALDRAFAEPDHPPYRRTKAVVILQDGQIVAERYAPGYGVDTPLLGWSATKSVTNALIGILVREGHLATDGPAPVEAWRDPADPRHAITIDELLRMTSGLDMGDSLSASLSSATNPAYRMEFIEPDKAGFSMRAGLAAAPGTSWTYTNANYLILSRLIRDAVGGHAADVVRFARQELFEPLGMRHVTIEFDATGTPIGSGYMLAPPRDWARFGALYLDDGVVGGRRILPPGWVGYSAAATPSADFGYGAGFWTNLGNSWGAAKRVTLGMPRDAFFARGQFGQYIVIVPSARLVVVRFGVSGDALGDITGVSRLVGDVVAALGDKPAADRLSSAGHSP